MVNFTLFYEITSLFCGAYYCQIHIYELFMIYLFYYKIILYKKYEYYFNLLNVYF